MDDKSKVFYPQRKPSSAFWQCAASATSSDLMPPKKVNTPFQDSHKLAWGVELISTSGDGGVTVRCMFCKYVGRDAAKIGPTTNRKRKARSGSHYYTAPFTSAKYK